MVVAQRADHVLKIRKHRKRLELFAKLATAKGAFPSFRVIGTKSGRMSGADGLNYHGIDGSKDIREIFTLAGDGEIVCGGDMNSQELAIAAAVMNDDNLARDIETGRSLHGEFASTILNCSYEQIMAKKEDKASPEGQAYAKAKVCIYAMLYGAASFNISITLGCTEAEAQSKMDRFFEKYPHMKSTRKFVTESLQCLSSDNGRIHVSRPDRDSIKSLFGYTRSFEIEMSVIRTIVDTMEFIRTKSGRDGGVAAFQALKQAKVYRKKDREQSVLGACMSALYGGAFSLQGKIQRAALNHLIQSAGRTCTLRVQKRIWDDVQPAGIGSFHVKLMSVHDEIVTVSKPEYAKPIREAVFSEMKALTEQVPLLSLDWADDVGSWYGVKAAEDGLRCGWDEEDEEDFTKMLEAEYTPNNLENIYD
jgi:DNA polymerase I-like protein with 3'-5' exonuclease and polymerase domains